ncbi:hypothetical protein T4E_4958 [Trichinella pseudospiralis]|uniref:FLYWCH-type domain-containing protein n=1 Tax=Trichinella pseudospiralis TaxID=6337 RepID=A0A0V0XGS3_TRIPS|nr:hypothetical protein T4E_4958 [Trichinella pseudospiralis]
MYIFLTETILFYFADVPELHLVLNRGGSRALVFEGREYKLNHTGKQKKCCRCSKYKKDCKGAVRTDLEVAAVIDRKHYVETCRVD